MSVDATILLCDSDAQPALEHALRLEGFGTRWLPSGNAALEALQSEPLPDLLLLDLDLPDISGLEVCRRVRRDRRSRALPVIIGMPSDCGGASGQKGWRGSARMSSTGPM